MCWETTHLREHDDLLNFNASAPDLSARGSFDGLRLADQTSQIAWKS
jgi:hypothetical protein